MMNRNLLPSLYELAITSKMLDKASNFPVFNNIFYKLYTTEDSCKILYYSDKEVTYILGQKSNGTKCCS